MASGGGKVEPLRVLLISPLRGFDPPNGDVSYTEGLLAMPPDGVEYVTYRQAMDAGELAWVGARGTVRPEGVARRTSLRALACRKAHRLLSRLGMTFREPPLTARVLGQFDLVHVHVFNVGFVGPHPPVVVSNACPTQVFYSDFEGWSPRRVRLAAAVSATLARVGGSRLISTSPLPDATWVLLTEFLLRYYVAMGVDPRRMFVVPNTVDDVPPGSVRTGGVIGFSARSFEGKGGPEVLEAFRMVRDVRPSLELQMVGHQVPSGLEMLHGVSWLGEIPRDRLLHEVLPTWSALVYPTRSDGSPYAAIEALATGCPVITVPYGAMPEIVPHGVAGWIAPSASPEHLAAAIEAVLDLERLDRLSRGARSWFESHFSPQATCPMLGRAYRSAIDAGGARS